MVPRRVAVPRSTSAPLCGRAVGGPWRPSSCGVGGAPVAVVAGAPAAAGRGSVTSMYGRRPSRGRPARRRRPIHLAARAGRAAEVDAPAVAELGRQPVSGDRHHWLIAAQLPRRGGEQRRSAPPRWPAVGRVRRRARARDRRQRARRPRRAAACRPRRRRRCWPPTSSAATGELLDDVDVACRAGNGSLTWIALHDRVGRDRSAQASRAGRPAWSCPAPATRARLRICARVGAALAVDRDVLNRDQRGVAKPEPARPGRPRADPADRARRARRLRRRVRTRGPRPRGPRACGTAVRDRRGRSLPRPEGAAAQRVPGERRRCRARLSASRAPAWSAASPSHPGPYQEFDPGRRTPTSGRRETGGNGPS